MLIKVTVMTRATIASEPAHSSWSHWGPNLPGWLIGGRTVDGMSWTKAVWEKPPLPQGCGERCEGFHGRVSRVSVTWRIALRSPSSLGGHLPLHQACEAEDGSWVLTDAACGPLCFSGHILPTSKIEQAPTSKVQEVVTYSCAVLCSVRDCLKMNSLLQSD